MLHTYDRFEPKSHAGENRKAVTGSPIISKVVCRDEHGVIYILVVFQKSTKQEFYWVFRARSARSSRKSWTYADHAARDFPYRPPYFDFGSFVAYYALMHRLDVLSHRVMHKKRLSTLLTTTRLEHESILANWAPQDPRTITQDLCRRRAARARSRYAR